MPVTRTDRNQVSDGKGNILHEEIVEVNVTPDDLRDKARQALTSNASFLAERRTTTQPAQQVERLARQVEVLSRQVNVLTRLVLGGEHVLDNPDT